MNFYKDGDVSPFKQTLMNVTVDRCWSQLLQQSDFEHRRAAVDQFNRYQFFSALENYLLAIYCTSLN